MKGFKKLSKLVDEAQWPAPNNGSICKTLLLINIKNKLHFMRTVCLNFCTK